MLKSLLRRSVDTGLPGAARLYRRKRDEHRARRLRPAPTQYGFTLVGDDGMAAHRTATNEVEVISETVSQADVFLDVGANVGFFTCLIARGDKHVIAVEPHPLNLRCLYQNLLANRFAAEVFPIALGAEAGVADLYGGGQGATLVKGFGGIVSTYSTPVAVNTLDNVIGGRFAGQRMVVKIDTEGHELAVLQGAAATLARTPRPAWIVEIVFAHNPHFRQIFNAFWSRGYEATSVEARRPVSPADVDRWLANGEQDFGIVNFLFR